MDSTMNKEVNTLAAKVINNLQNMLESQRRDILANGKTLRVDYTVNKDELLDEVDTAAHDVEQGMMMRLGNRESLYFRKVEEALLRIKDGTYGLCVECGGHIGAKRLEVRPTAELCIECKEAAETAETKNAEGRRHKSLGEVINFRA
jgi:DnaK suppressor protein